MTIEKLFRSLTAMSLLAGVACDPESATLPVGDGDTTKVLDENGKADASAEAVFVDFEFDGELVTNFAFNAEGIVEDQLLYTIGHLNGDNSVGRLDRLELTDVRTESAGSGLTRISYHARLPVAWGDKLNVPTRYTLRLPANMTSGALTDFSDRYGTSCVDFSQAHDVDPGNMWYYYRPDVSPCSIDDGDIVVLDADVSLSESNTTGKFPEYDKIWEDDTLQVVAVFGKNEATSTSDFDAGISAYNRFVRSVSSELAGTDVVTEPAVVPFNPGVDNPDVQFTADIGDGKTVLINALLVDNVRTAGATFNARYEALSTRADLIAYNGHAGLGANIRALAARGHWVAEQYVVVFMDGCDTFAYVDSALFDAHSAVNPDDPEGTKHLDIVTNAMPAFFSEIDNNTMVLLRGLMSHDEPQTYEQMFAQIDSRQVILVSGEEDNTFVPGGGGDGGGEEWEGLDEDGRVARNQEVHFETPVLEAGQYTFTLSGNQDADLYVRVGARPSFNAYDCRPFLNGSSETCRVDLPASASIHVMVRGWATSSDWELSGRPE